MNVISATRTQIVLHPSKHDENWRAFIFDIGIIPDKPTPKKVVIQKKVGAYLISWSMSWTKFLKQTCIDTVVIIEKSAFKYESRRTSRASDGLESPAKKSVFTAEVFRPAKKRKVTSRD